MGNNDMLLKMKISGKFQQQSLKYKGLFRIFYEGKLIKSSFQIFTHRETNEINGTKIRIIYPNWPKKEKSIFQVEQNFKILPTGIYMSIFRVTDMSDQLYVDNFSIFRVRLKNEDVDDEIFKNSFEITKKFRSFACNEEDILKEKYKNFCFPYGNSTNDSKEKSNF